MTYICTHALILIYSKHITVTNIRIFMSSYNKLIRLLVLIANLYLFKFPIGYILVLIVDLCLFRSPVGVTELILILILLADLYMYRGTRRYYRTYTYTEVPVDTFRAERCPLL